MEFIYDPMKNYIILMQTDSILQVDFNSLTNSQLLLQQNFKTIQSILSAHSNSIHDLEQQSKQFTGKMQPLSNDLKRYSQQVNLIKVGNQRICKMIKDLSNKQNKDKQNLGICIQRVGELEKSQMKIRKQVQCWMQNSRQKEQCHKSSIAQLYKKIKNNKIYSKQKQKAYEQQLSALKNQFLTNYNQTQTHQKNLSEYKPPEYRKKISKRQTFEIKSCKLQKLAEGILSLERQMSLGVTKEFFNKQIKRIQNKFEIQQKNLEDMSELLRSDLKVTNQRLDTVNEENEVLLQQVKKQFLEKQTQLRQQLMVRQQRIKQDLISYMEGQNERKITKEFEIIQGKVKKEQQSLWKGIVEQFVKIQKEIQNLRQGRKCQRKQRIQNEQQSKVHMKQNNYIDLKHQIRQQLNIFHKKITHQIENFTTTITNSTHQQFTILAHQIQTIQAKLSINHKNKKQFFQNTHQQSQEPLATKFSWTCLSCQSPQPAFYGKIGKQINHNMLTSKLQSTKILKRSNQLPEIVRKEATLGKVE